MVDSEPASIRSWSVALIRLGAAAEPSDIERWVGHTDRAIAEHYAPLLGMESASVLDFAELELRRVLSTDGVRQFPDAVRLLDTAFQRQLPVAVATNSVRWRLDAVLEAAGLGHLIPLSVASDEVRAPKPAPDVYVEAVGRLGVEASRVMVIEDTPTGIAAGRAAGCRVVAVDRGVFAHGSLADADLVVDSLG